MKITKPNITEGEWNIDKYNTLVNVYGNSVSVGANISTPMSGADDVEKANAKAIRAVPDMIDALIYDIEVLELCAELMAQKDMSYEFINMRIDKNKKALEKAGCTYEP